MTRPTWSVPALADLDRIFDFVAEHDTHAALRIVDDIVVQTSRRLGEHALLGPSAGPGRLRKLSLLRRPYVVLYRFEAGRVDILRVRHAAEDWLA